jgi:predicted RNase H-like HicB family nuclease
VRDYLINVFYSEKDECCVADIPDLKYCSGLGDTPEQAVREVTRAKRAWLAAAKKEGKPIPKPRRRPTGFPGLSES